MDHNDILESLDDSGELAELIKTRKWAVVSDVCEKGTERGEKHDVLQILRSIALILDEKTSERETGLQTLDNLLRKNPPVTDPAALSLLESLQQSVTQHERISPHLDRIWERATSSLTGNNAWLFKAWFKAKFRKGFYNEAKKAAMAWMKTYPKEHDPFYLFIIINYLISRSPQISPTERRLCQMLAFKALSTAANDTVATDQSNAKKTGRLLTSRDDLSILISVYKGQGRHEDALKVLVQQRKSLVSQDKSLRWELALQTIDLEGACGNLESQWVACSKILRAARPAKFSQDDHDQSLSFGERGDDWKIWDILIVTASKLRHEKPELVAQTEQLLIDYTNPRSRNASLASLKLHSQLFPDLTAKKLLKKCQKYFEDNSSKVACLRDLRPHLAGLSRSHQRILVNNITRQSKDQRVRGPVTKAKCVDFIIAQVNALKLDYNTIVSRSKDKDVAVLLSSFSNTCLRLYRASTLLDLGLPQSDQGPAEEAAILATMACIRLYHLGHRSAILRSVVILEDLLTHSRHNYEALLIIVHAYLYLGLGSLAIERYAQLSVKNIQQASISWILFTQISRIHPWPVGIRLEATSTVNFDPLEELRIALGWHRAATISTDKALDRVWSKHQYSTMLGLLGTQDLLQHSVGRLVADLEYQAIHQMRPHSQEEVTAAPIVPPGLHDSRDRTAFPNYEPVNQPEFVDMIPRIVTYSDLKPSWLIHNLNLAHVRGRIRGFSRDASLTAQIQKLQAMLPASLDGGITLLEAKVVSVLTGLEDNVRLSTSVSSPTEKASAHLNHLERQLLDLTESGKQLMPQDGPGFGDVRLSQRCHVPLWFAVHGYFTLISVSDLILEAMQSFKQRSATDTCQQKDLQEKIAHIQSLCMQVKTDVSAQVSKQREMLRSPEFEQLLRNEVRGDELDLLGKPLESVLGAEAVTKICRSMCDSYVDAFDGVIRSSSGSQDYEGISGAILC